jgi:hypothetical protein
MSLDGTATPLARSLELIGLDTAPDYFINGIARVEFLGVNTQVIVYRLSKTGSGDICQRVPYTVTFPTGALPYMIRQLYEFCREQRIVSHWNHDAAR